jgi:two-component system chemotaxis response regulator CheY
MSYSILIVDDSLPMRSVIKRTFKAAGYGNSQFYEAGNGKDALELMQNNWIDIVSTEGNETKIKAFMDSGAAGYITKPFTPEIIRDLITKLLGEVSYDENFDNNDEDLDF